MPDLPSMPVILEALQRLYAVKNVADFPSHLMSVISELLSAKYISFDQIDLATGLATNVFDRPIPVSHREFMLRWQVHCHEHPGIAHLENGGSASVFRISDFMTLRQFRQTGLYAELAHPFGVRDQLGIILPVTGHILGVAVNRDTGFTEDEKTLVQMLQPHFVRAFENAQLFTSLTEVPETDYRPWRNFGLTHRECEVLRWVMEGKRNSEIAIILNAQPRTIGKHLENIFAKLGVETRAAAAAQARYLIDPSQILPDQGGK